MSGNAIQWTEAQNRAITGPVTDMLVSAAAGSGKTTVLVQRVLHLITRAQPPAELQRLLVVTFTEAAASSMREKLAREIQKRLAEHPGDERLREQLFQLEDAQISTIHAFCRRILARHYAEMNLDPGFRVLDSNEASMLQQEVLSDLFETMSREDTEAGKCFSDLLFQYAAPTSDDPLREVVLDAAGFLDGVLDPDGWYRTAASLYDRDAGTLIASSLFSNRVSDGLGYVNLLLTQAAEEARQHNLKGYLEYIPEYLDSLTAAAGSARKGLHRKLYDWLRELKFAKLPSVKEGVPGKAETKALLDKAKKVYGDLQKRMFSWSLEEIDRSIERVRPSAKTLVALIRAFRKQYGEAKARLGVLDFADLERMAFSLLKTHDSPGSDPNPSEIAESLQRRFTHVFIDEYQDTSPLQEAILRLVSRAASDRWKTGNRFMVGDVKQCIYGFRHARPELFVEKLDSFSEDAGSGSLRIDLQENFRSVKPLIEGINALFRPIFSREVGGVDYDARSELRFGARYPEADRADGPAIEMHLLSKPEAGETEPGEDDEEEASRLGMEDLEAAEREAIWIGKRILEITGRTGGSQPHWTVFDEKIAAPRPVRYGDIVILLRAITYRAEQIARKLGEMGIPVLADTKTGLFRSPAVMDVLSLLRVLDLPGRDVPLAALLRSPFFGWSETDLFRVRLAGKQVSFQDALEQAASSTEDRGFRERCRETLERLRAWRNLAACTPLSVLLETILSERGYLESLEGLSEGAVERANVDQLLRMARTWEASHSSEIAGFTRFLQALEKAGMDEGAAQPLADGEDVVRVMSIHKSKGLEFPVVFVACLEKQFNFLDARGDILMDREAGVGLVEVQPERFVKYRTIPHVLLADVKKAKARSEEMRILYVALSRARERLILSATVEPIPAIKSWAGSAGKDGSIPRERTAEALSAMDWLGPALLSGDPGATLRELDEECLKGADPIEVRGPLVSITIHPWREVSGWKPGRPSVRDTGNLLPLIASGKPVPGFPSGPEIDALLERLLWKYPHEAATRLPARRSATEVARMTPAGAVPDPEMEYVFRTHLMPRPKWMSDGTASAAERGLAVHRFLEKLDFHIEPIPEAVEKEIQRAVDTGRLLEEERSYIQREKVLQFLTSDVGGRIRNGTDIRREVDFILRIPTEELTPSVPDGTENEAVLFRGKIDCLLVESDGAVIVDYKTDRIDPGEEKERAEKYRMQMTVYRRAVIESLRVPVKEVVVYFHETGTGVRLDP